MGSILVGLLAETFIHSGAGSNEGAIDLPVAREAATGYPFIPGSGMKGALRDLAEQENKSWVGTCFGRELDHAGGVLVGDARLLLLSVRSLTGSYKWLTCPHIVERLHRDMQRAGFSQDELPQIPEEPEDGKLFGKGEKNIFLEERTFEFQEKLPENLVSSIGKYIPNAETKKRLADQLVVVNNREFSWFTSFALPVQARNDLNDETKESKNLWYEESLPPDTLMYSLLAERIADSSLNDLITLLGDKGFFQAGGNETVGQGWFGVQVVKPAAEEVTP